LGKGENQFRKKKSKNKVVRNGVKKTVHLNVGRDIPGIRGKAETVNEN